MSEQSLQALLDKEAIREVVLRYTRGVDRGDLDLLASAYHDDAVDEHGASHFEGRAIAPGILELVRPSRISMHQVTNQTIVLHGPDAAAAESYFTAWQSLDIGGEERMLVALGRYADRFEKREGEWRISRRVVIVEYTNVLAPDPTYTSASPGLATRNSDDPTYDVLGGRASGVLAD